MANFLRHWLQPLIKSELLRANNRLAPERFTNFNLYFDKGRPAQVIDVNGNDAVLSDGTNTIRASFDPPAVFQLQKFSGWSLSKVKGAIIVVEKYYLIFNPESVTLRVLQCRIQGCEGSPTFYRPSSVLADKEIRDLLARWENEASSHDKPKSSSQHRQIAGDKAILAKVNDARSQHRLSTQTPAAAAQNNSAENELASQVPQNLVSHTELETTKTSAPARTGTGHDLLALLNKPKQPTALEEEPAWKAQMEVQKRIVQQQRQSTNLVGEGSSLSIGVPRQRPASEAEKVVCDDTSPQALTQIPQQYAADMTPKLKSPANRKAKGLSTGPEINIEVPDPAMNAHDDLPSSQGSEKENSQEFRNSRKMARTNDLEATASAPLIKDPSPPFEDAFQTQNPFEGLKGIPRKYMRISTPQAILLNSKDAWFSGNETSRNYAHIPIGIQDGIVAFKTKASAPPNEKEAHRSRQEVMERKAEQEASLNPETEDDESDSSGYESALDDMPSNRKRSPVSKTAMKVDDSDHAASDWSLSPPREPGLHRNEVAEGSIAAQGSPSPATAPNLKIAVPARLRVPFTVPFDSSPVEEDEIDMAVPYAEGEIVEAEEDEDMPDVSTASQDYPSTAQGGPKFALVQVEKTPHPNSRTSNGHQQRVDSSLEKVTRRVPSSDPRIPATFNDTLSDEDESNDIEYLDEEQKQPSYAPAVTKSSFRIGVLDLCSDSESGDEDDTEPMAQTRLLPEVQRQESLDETVPMNQRSDHGKDEVMEDELEEQEERFTSPRLGHDQSEAELLAHNKRSVAFAPSPTFASREPSLKRSFEDVVEEPTKIYVKKQKRFKIATTLADIDHSPIDTKAIARAHRQSFKDSLKTQLLAAAQNQARFSQRSSPVAGSQTSPRVIPNSIPAGSTASRLSPKVPASLTGQETIPRTQSSPISHPSGKRRPSQIIETEAAYDSDTEGAIVDVMEGVETAPTRDDRTIEHVGSIHKASRAEYYVASDMPVEESEMEASREVYSELEAKSAPIKQEAEDFEEENIYGASYERAEDKIDYSKCIGYDEFKANHPSYATDKKNFTWALVYVEFLLRTKNLTESSNLDEFICILASDYIPWCRSVKPEERIPGVDFYRKRQFEDSRFQLGLVTVNNLQDHLASLDQRQVDDFRSKFAEPKPADEPASKFNPSSRKPFFETASQLPRPHDAPESSAKRTPSTRTLPWAKPTPAVAPSSSSRSGVRLPSPQPHIPQRSSPMAAILSTSPKVQRQQGSPILGFSPFVAHRKSVESIPTPFSPQPQPKNESATVVIASTSKQQPKSKTSSTAPSNVSLEALNRMKSNEKGLNSVEKVKGWVVRASDADPPEEIRSAPRPVAARPAVKDFSRSFNGTGTSKIKDENFVEGIKRLVEKRQSMGNLSRRGTPDSKGKGKERAERESFGASSRGRVERRYEEPETQGWGDV